MGTSLRMRTIEDQIGQIDSLLRLVREWVDCLLAVIILLLKINDRTNPPEKKMKSSVLCELIRFNYSGHLQHCSYISTRQSIRIITQRNRVDKSLQENVKKLITGSQSTLSFCDTITSYESNKQITDDDVCKIKDRFSNIIA